MLDLIYYNGDIVTVEDSNMYVEAIGIKEGLINKLGTKEEVLKHANEETKLIDLEGKTLLPGFIDSHSHLIPTSQVASYIDLSSAPLGDIESIEDIINKIKKEIEEKSIPEGELVVAKGYDDTLLKEGRSPNKFDLDKASSKHKIYILHCSLHVAVANSMVLEELGIDENTPEVEGGVIKRLEGSNEPNGVLEENAHIQLGSRVFPHPKPEDLAKMFIVGQEEYTREGITTVQDGGLNGMYYNLLKAMSEAGILKVDVVGYHLVNNKEEVKTALETVNNFGEYKNNFKMGGFKVLLDGSPQASTAWLSSPYHTIPSDKKEGYSGYGTIEDNEVVTSICEEVIKTGHQLLVHNNGDQASEQFLDCYEKALSNTKNTDDLRPVMIHAQTVREDQLDRMQKISMIPSFFILHTYFWGDLHLNTTLGPVRGARISPAKSALKRNIPFTLHADSPVLPSNIMFMMWSAVNRITRNGVEIGKDQCVETLDALKAVTINAAYQYHEEDIKGSLKEGKFADLVILNKNPLKTEKLDIKDIEVLETIKRGETIFKK